MKRNILILFFVIGSLLPPAGLLATGKYSDVGGLCLEAGGLSRADEFAMGAGIGFFGIPSKYFSFHGTFSFLGSDGIDNYYTGFELGVRLGLGTRVSPFVGVGGFYGSIKEYVSANDDNRDNDGDGAIDEYGEQAEIIKDALATIYPEIGFFCWINDMTRLSFSGKYQITTEGRDYDFWLFTIGLSFAFEE